MSALLKIQQSGFNLALTDDGNLEITPASKLTQQQREFLRSHKAQIIGELKRLNQPKPSLIDYQAAKPKILSWLHWIGENSQTIIDEVLAKCRNNPETLAYFAQRAKEAPGNIDNLDDRHHCRECTNIASNGQCRAAWRGEIDAAKQYAPVDGMPRRCSAFKPRNNP